MAIRKLKTVAMSKPKREDVVELLNLKEPNIYYLYPSASAIYFGADEPGKRFRLVNPAELKLVEGRHWTYSGNLAWEVTFHVPNDVLTFQVIAPTGSRALSLAVGKGSRAKGLTPAGFEAYVSKHKTTVHFH